MSKPRKLRSRKAGLPPGTLVHIGEIKTANPCITLFDFDASGFSELGPRTISELDRRNPNFAIRWANFYGVTNPETLSSVGRVFDLHPLVQEDILNTAQRQKIDAYDDYLYVVLHRYDLDPRSLELTQDQISLVIGKDFLLTFQERPSQTWEPVRQRLRADRSNLRRSGVDALAHSLVDAVVDGYFGVIEQLNDQAEDLEGRIMGHPVPHDLERIHQLKRCASRLRRDLHPLREVLGILYRDSVDFFTPETQLYLRDIHDHALHIIESLDDLRELSTSLLDVYLSTVSHRVNLQVRALTMIATVFMPASLIAGIFGMNFHVMPWLEQADGFYYALVLMSLVASVMLVIIWWRRGD